MRFVRKAIIVLAIVIAAIIVVVLIAVQTSPVRHYVLSKLKSTLSEQGIDLNASNLSLNPAALSATLNDVVIRSGTAPDLPPIVKADRVYVNLAAVPLLSGKYEISDAQITRPEIHVVMGANGKNNIPGTGSSTTQPQQSTSNSSGTSFQVDKLSVSNASLVFENRAQQMTLTLPKWNVRYNQGGSSGREIAFTTDKPGSAVMQGRTVAIQDISLKGEVAPDNNSAKIQSATIQAAGSSLTLHGSVQNLSSTPKLDFQGQGDIALAPLSQFTGMPNKASGDLHLQFSASGPVSNADATLQLSGKNLQIADIKSINLDTQAVYNGSAGAVQLNHLKMNSSAGGLDASGRIALSPSAGQSTLRAQLDQLNLEKFTRLLNSKMQIASKATGTVQLSWPGMNYKQADGIAKLHMAKLQAQPSKNVLPLSGRITARMDNGKITLSLGQQAAIQPEIETPHHDAEAHSAEIHSIPRWAAPHFREITVENVQLNHLQDAVYHPTYGIGPRLIQTAGTVGAITVPARTLLALLLGQTPGAGTANGFQAVQTLSTLLRGKVTITPTGQLSGTLHAHVTSLSDLLDKIAALQGAPPSKIPLAGEANITAKLSGSTSSPVIDLQVTAPSLSLANINNVDLRVNGVYRGTELVIRQMTANWQGGSVNAQGKLGLAKRAPMDLTATVQNLDISPVLAALGKSNMPVSGAVSANAKITGTFDNPSAIVQATARQLKAYGQGWGTLDLQANLANHVLDLTSLTLDQTPGQVGGGKLQATASYNLKTTSYSVDLNGNSLQIGKVQLPSGATLQGAVSLQASGQGTRDNPQLTASVNGSNIGYGEEQIGPVNVALNLANQRAQLQASVPAINFAVRADVGTKAPYPAQIQLNADSVDLAKLPLATIRKKNVTGTFTANVRASGPLQNPAQLNATAQITELKLNREGFELNTVGPVDVAYQNQVVKIQPATLEANGSKLNIAGQMPLKAGTVPGNLRINGNMDLEALSDFVPSLQTSILAGTLSLDMALKGNLHNIIPEGRLQLQHAYYGSAAIESPIEDANLLAVLQNGIVTLEQANARWSGAQIAAHGKLPLSLLPAKLPIATLPAHGPAQFSLTISGLSTSQFPGVPTQVKGTISAQLDATAPKLTLADLQAALRFNQLDFTLNGIPIQQQGQSVITVQNATARIEHFQLAGPDTELILAGTAGLLAPRVLNVRMEGKTNIALASTFVTSVKMSGRTNFQVAATGTVQKPDLNGFLRLRNAQIAMKEPMVAATGLNLQVDLSGQHVQIASLNGTLNGGSLTGNGGFDFMNGAVQNVNIQIGAQDVYFNYPEGLRTVSNLNLNLRSRETLFVLGGNVSVLQGSFRRYINLQKQVLDFVSFGGAPIQLAGEQTPFLSKLRFDVAVDTKSPLLIENNVAKAAVIANLKLVGAYYQPSITGRIQLEETGELFLNGNTFYIDRGVVTFTSAERILPTVNLVAETQKSGYDITMQVEGPAGNTKTTLTSDPPMGEADIISVLVFGQPLQQVRGSELTVASNSALAYVAGGLGSALSNQLQNAIGLSEVRLEPVLIAGEANPNARLTIGQNLTHALKLIYSMNVINAGDIIWAGEYDITRRFTTRITKQTDNSYRFDIKNDWSFGGTPLVGTFRQKSSTVSDVTFTGNTFLTDKQLQDKLGIKPGDKYDFFKVQKGTDRIENYYYDKNRLEARVQLHTKHQGSSVALRLHVSPGPTVRFVYEGWSPPGSLKKQINTIWRQGVFDLQRAQDSVAAIKTSLIKKRYLQPKIEYEIKNPRPDERMVIFTVESGTRFSKVETTFPGAKYVSPDELVEVLRSAKIRDQVLTDPEHVKSALETYYHDHGFLTAKVADPKVVADTQTNTGRIEIPIAEGPRYTIGSVQFNGIHAFSASQLQSQAELPDGTVYTPGLRDNAIMKLQNIYWNQGYNDVSIQYALVPDKNTGKVKITFNVTEGRQQILHSVNVTGTKETSPSLVRSQLLLKPGDILAADKLSKSRQNIYDTNAYQFIEVNQPEVEAPSGLSPNQEAVDLNVRVHEVQPFHFRYGGYYDTDRGPGVILDFSNSNTLGDARVLGMRARYDKDLQDFRIYFSQPSLRRFPVRSIAETYYTRDVHTAFIDDRLGVSIGQEAHFHKDYVLNYSYNIERARDFNLTGTPLEAVASSTGGTGLPPNAGGPPPVGEPGSPTPTPPTNPTSVTDNTVVPPYGSISNRVAPLTATLSRDTRDDILDATKGLFISNGGSFAFKYLGSAVQYLKYYGQYYQFIPLGKPLPVPFKPFAKRPRFIYAGALRLGFAGGLAGQSLIPSERFFAGGGTTIRGFKQDEVGPKNADGVPVGGNALFLLNNEVRFPLISIFDGAGFIDVGNVYSNVSDFNPFKVRSSAGFGLRVHTPWVLIRADYGVKLDRKSGESRGAFFISIGQAF